MSNKKKEPSGCGCANIPISVIIILLGCGYGLFSQRDKIDVYRFFPQLQQITFPAFLNLNSTPIVDYSPISSPTTKIPNQKNEDVNNTNVAVSNPTPKNVDDNQDSAKLQIENTNPQPTKVTIVNPSPTPVIIPSPKIPEPVKTKNPNKTEITSPAKIKEPVKPKTTNKKYPKISAKNWNQKAIRVFI